MTTGDSLVRRGFAAVEAAMLVVVAVVAVSVLIGLGVKTRAAGGLNRDLGNLRLFGQWTGMYAADFGDLTWTLTSRDSQWPALDPVPGEDLRNAAKQAIDTIRRRTGRETFPLPNGWIAHILFSHLALADYADAPLPDRRFVAAGDVHRMNWTDDPVNKHDQGFWQPFQQPSGGGAPGDADKRWPYTSSYTLTPAWFDEGQNELGSAPRLRQVGSHNSYSLPPNINLGAPRLSDVAYPGGKVVFQDYGSWYSGREPRYFGVPEASVSVLLADGAASAKRTRDSNPGWDPASPSSPSATRYSYAPRSWEPPASSGSSAEPIRAGYYRWTRGGVLGRDFGGAEIDTGQR